MRRTASLMEDDVYADDDYDDPFGGMADVLSDEVVGEVVPAGPTEQEAEAAIISQPPVEQNVQVRCCSSNQQLQNYMIAWPHPILKHWLHRSKAAGSCASRQATRVTRCSTGSMSRPGRVRVSPIFIAAACTRRPRRRPTTASQPWTPLSTPTWYATVALKFLACADFRRSKCALTHDQRS